MKLFDDKKKVKTVRVLVYPNITFQEDLEKDSYIQVIKNQISLLNEIRSDLWFYLILPCPVTSLAFDNVTQLYIDFETYPQTMRSNFRVDVIRKMLHRGYDFDLVMSHLPEHTHQLVNTMYNTTHHVPPVFGYCHWWDLKGVVTWPKDSFLQNITGLLEYDRCYLNTQHQKDLVLNQASKTFVPKVINKLNKILTVQHLGVNNSDIVSEINKTPEKIIVFNHRPDTYKHFKQFIAVCDELYKMRQDFKVWIPLLDKPNRDYVITNKGDKQWYYKGLQNCYMGFSPKQKYGGWSVAMTDGMMNGVPYIMYDDTYYHELNDNGEFFKNDHEALMLMNTYLDDPKYRNEQAEQALDCIRENLIYKDSVIEMNNYMNDLLDRQKSMRAPNILSDRKTDRLSEIIELIRKGATTKKHIMDYLGWGRGIKWTPYRRALMNHPNIYDVMDDYPTYVWIDSINQ
jgi:glycosyltransferase involved in cell wall biosynthesis